MKRGQETNHIRKQEAGTQDTHETPLTRMRRFVLNKHQFERLRLSVGCVLNRVLSLTLQLVRYRVTREKDRGKSLGQCYSCLFTQEGSWAMQTSDHFKYS